MSCQPFLCLLLWLFWHRYFLSRILLPEIVLTPLLCFMYISSEDDHILRKLQPKGIWYLTVLGSLATTQREYVALHAFHRLNSQVELSFLASYNLLSLARIFI